MQGFRVGLRVFASRNSVKKSRKKEKSQKYDTSPSNKAVLEENDAVSNTPPLADNYIQENSNTSSFNHSEAQSTLLIPSRGAVLRACTITSCLIGTLGVVIRQLNVLFPAFTRRERGGWVIYSGLLVMVFACPPFPFLQSYFKKTGSV